MAFDKIKQLHDIQMQTHVFLLELTKSAIQTEGQESLNQKSMKKATLMNQLNLISRKAQNIDAENLMPDQFQVNTNSSRK